MMVPSANGRCDIARAISIGGSARHCEGIKRGDASRQMESWHRRPVKAEIDHG